MGYFSKLNLTLQEQGEDRSYPSFECQLLWRLEDLKDRYAELIAKGAPYHGDDYYTADDYRYAPPSCFRTVADAWRAIELVKEDLAIKCDIFVREDGSIEEIQDVDEPDPNQLSVLEIVYLPSWFHTAMAA